jgi:hypothetical protein
MNRMQGETLADLHAVLDRIIPGDEYLSACAAGVPAFILDLWAAGSDASEEAVLQGLAGLAGFAQLSVQAQDEALGAVADCPWFSHLCELAAEGYYADPGNGANPDTQSWQMIGYVSGLPEGADGPQVDPRDAVKGRLRA